MGGLGLEGRAGAVVWTLAAAMPLDTPVEIWGKPRLGM